jgi:hypothetical protein
VIQNRPGSRVIEVEARLKSKGASEIIMAMKPLVRIVKRGQQAAGLERAESAAPQNGAAAAVSSARAIKATVSTWVKEFQLKRGPSDSRRAFNNLFKDSLPRPSET